MLEIESMGMHGFGGSGDKLDGYGINTSQQDGGKAAALSSLHIIQSNVTEEDKAPSRRLSDKGFGAAFIEITNLVQQFIMELGARETSSDS